MRASGLDDDSIIQIFRSISDQAKKVRGKPRPYKLCARGLEVEGALFLKQSEVAQDVLLYFRRFGF